MAGAPFERYPGQPRGGGEVYRVISPHRDALAWIGNADKLAVVRFMVREGDDWRILVDDARDAGHATSLWTFVERDPVELRFHSTDAAGMDVSAFVTVSPDGCEVRIVGNVPLDAVAPFIQTGVRMRVRTADS